MDCLSAVSGFWLAWSFSAKSDNGVRGYAFRGGTVMPVESIVECLQVAFDSGGQRVVLPMSSAMDIPSILPPELFTRFHTNFYADSVDAVFKALGVN